MNDLKKSDTWGIWLTMALNFISSKDNDEECIMHSKSDNIEIMVNNETVVSYKRNILNQSLIDIKII